jgi:CheY-like chemotaxis protein
MIAETLTRDPPRSGDDSRLKDLTEFGIIVDRMLGEILDFSAIDQANMPMALIPVSITDILGSSVKQNQFNIQKALVNITLAIDPELKEVVIKTDRNWMIKILTNLIVNALEYSESERVEVGAKCHRLSPEHVELEIFVKDWGKGIDDAEKDFVFERFYRGESGIDSGKHGTGLGLSICQDVAHAMGAHLGLADNKPSGCYFFLKGRFARVAGAKELDQNAVLAQLKGKKVLIVDDLSYNRRSIVDFFKTIGCICDDCENGRVALQMLEDNAYDLALLDWDLPGLMGPEISTLHRHNHPEDKVILIALTAYTDGEKLRESQQAGMNGYISKPLTASRLAYALANVEEKRPQRPATSDMVDLEELNEEIYKHIRDCLMYGQQTDWESLRRCAHRLTTLALMRNNPAMQQVCRDLQVAAQSADVAEIHIGLAELQQWDRG